LIDAELKNKIPKLETWEDILTSNVFGLLDLIDYKYLLEIISKAKNIEGTLISDSSLFIGRKVKNLELWKNFKIGEPDIVVTLDNDSFFIIEVKYFSHEHNRKNNKSSENKSIKHQDDIKKGQLAKYLDIEIKGKQSKFIIYLTQDYQSLKVIQNSNESTANSKARINDIYHIHWDDFNEFLINIRDVNGIEKKIIDKIIEYLNFKGFTFWRGLNIKMNMKN